MKPRSSLAAIAAGCAALTMLMAPSAVLGQAKRAAIFVSNNGNLEGSVTALSLNDDGTLTFVNRVITGTRPSISNPCAGCNAYEIGLSPNGRYLATAHAAGDLDGLAVFSVAPSATIANLLLLSLPIGLGTPGDVVWIDNEYLATTRTDTNPDQMVVYRFDPAGPSLTQVDFEPLLSNSLFYLTVDRVRRVLYANESSSGNRVNAFNVDAMGNLSPLQSISTPLFPLEIVVSPQRNWLFAGCGIAGTGRDVLGFSLDAAGVMTPLTGSPFTLTGGSPAHIAFSGDNAIFAVGGGSTGDVTSYTMDQVTGVPTYTGNTIDIGIQGDIGDVQFLRSFCFVTRTSSTPRGVRSYSVSPAGAFTPNGAQVDTLGIAPRSIATWAPIIGNLNCDLAVDGLDIPAFVLALVDPSAYATLYAGCNILSGDVNGDGAVNGDDVQPFVALLLAP